MAADARRRVNEILEAALRRPPRQRRQYVASRCGDDADLRQKVDSLLAAAGEASEAAMSPASIDRTRSASGVDGGSLAADAAQPVLPPGSFVGPYAISARLGIGGMGEVYLARDTRLHRDVAIKLLPPAFATDVGRRIRFEQEGRAVASLNHPNIVSVHDVGVNDGMPYIVMEYVRGETLSAHAQREPLSCARVLQVGSEIAAALVDAHEHRVVHRDLKPSNVMITSGGLVKVVDFGIAKTPLAEPPPAALDSAFHDISRTQPGQLIGTPGYMSPEQLLGGLVDHRTDIYSLGVILFELLTGRLPFPGHDLVALHEAALTLTPPRASDIDSSVPAAVSDLIAQALSKDPPGRPSAAVLRAELNALLARPTQTRTDAQSVAVLSFSDMSPAKDHEFFCDGMAEELINALSRVPGLRVAARTSAFQFKGKIRDARVIGDALNVATVVDGSVRKDGSRLRLTFELISAADGLVLWSERFDGDMNDVFALQDEVTRSVVAALRGHLVADRPRISGAPRRTNVEAYRLYLEGRYHWNNRTEEELHKSITCFERAIEVDPGHAPSYAAIADAYVTLATYGARPAGDVMPRAADALARALEIDPFLSQAHACRGCVRSLYEWDWPAAEEDFRRALALNSAYPTAYHWYAINHLVPRARFEEAADALHRAMALDPLALAIRTSLGMTSYFEGRYEEAVEHLIKTIELDQRFGLARLFLGATYTEQAKYADAHAELEAATRLSGPAPDVLAAVGYLHGRSSDPEAARTVLDRLRRLSSERYVSPARLAQVHLGLGETEEGLTMLERAHEERAADLAWIGVRPVFAPIRREPRFVTLLQRMGLAPATIRRLP